MTYLVRKRHRGRFYWEEYRSIRKGKQVISKYVRNVPVGGRPSAEALRHLGRQRLKELTGETPRRLSGNLLKRLGLREWQKMVTVAKAEERAMKERAPSGRELRRKKGRERLDAEQAKGERELAQALARQTKAKVDLNLKETYVLAVADTDDLTNDTRHATVSRLLNYTIDREPTPTQLKRDPSLRKYRIDSETKASYEMAVLDAQDLTSEERRDQIRRIRDDKVKAEIVASMRKAAARWEAFAVRFPEEAAEGAGRNPGNVKADTVEAIKTAAVLWRQGVARLV